MFLSRFLATLLLASVMNQGQAIPKRRAVLLRTRAEVVQMLLQAKSPLLPLIPNNGQFTDVPPDAWFARAMVAAEQYGIVRADPVTKALRPSGSVNRAEFLKMLTVTFNVPTGYPHLYEDVKKDDWFSVFAGVSARYDLFGLKNATRLEPQRLLTPVDTANALRIFLERTKAEQEKNTDDGIHLTDAEPAHKLQVFSILSIKKQSAPLTDPLTLQKAAPVTQLPPGLPTLRTKVLQLVNDIRNAAGLKPLRYNNTLEQSAQTYADRMAKEGFFGHVSPDGQILKQRLEASGYYNRSFSEDCHCIKGYSIGENLARGQKTPEQAVADWMKSASHKAAILNPDYTDTGIGVAAGIWVEHFGGVLLPNGPLARR